MVRGDPSGEGADGGDPGVGMVAAQRSGPGAKRFMEDAVVAGGAGDSLVEDGDFDSIVIVEERLEVEIGDEGAGGAEGVEQGLKDDVGAAHDGANGSNTGMDHEHAARCNA